MKRWNLNSIRLSLALLVALAFACEGESRAEPAPSRRPQIAKGDDPAAVLGIPRAERDLGQPAAVDRGLEEALAKVHTSPGRMPVLQVAVDGKTLDLPLEHTHVDATITGYVAEVEVVQSYENPFAYPIEAVYVFPLPENSAVNDMKMVIGERVIEAKIKKRAEARRTYERAKRRGHTAALLEQERPNIFTQSVANIAPGEEIEVRVRYVQDLTYDSGEYEFVFPMVVGPRFVPGAPTGEATGSGWARDTDQVPDASRITPPLVGGGLRTGHDISLDVRVDAGFPVAGYDVPTHQVVRASTADGTLALSLAPADSLPNRDFVLKYAVAAAEPRATLLTHGGYFTLIVQPPDVDVDALVGRREIIFVVDVSGSMSGVPLAMCKHAMVEAVESLRPVDTFNVITFESRTGQLFARPRPANDVNIREALRFVSGLRAGGGTVMAGGVQAALSTDVEAGRNRYVFFMTDGYIGNESAIMGLTREFVERLEERGQRARVFSFGTGSSVNRHLLDGLAKAGRGLAAYATNREDPAIGVDRFFGAIDYPVLEDVVVDWGSMRVSELFPADPGTLFASRPLIVHGRFEGKRTEGIGVRGRVGDRRLHIPLDLEHVRAEADDVLVSLWARAKIDWYEQQLAYGGHDPAVVKEITDLGLAHRLVTRFTSFVAVDRSRRVKGKGRTVVQPVEAPEGVDPHMAGAKVVGGIHDVLRGGDVGTNYGYGGLGLSGVGRGGGGGSGSGYGRGSGGFGVRGVAAPQIRSSAVVVRGSLDKGVVRRVIRRRMNEVKACYNRLLAVDPTASGRVVVTFVIAADGSVKKVVVKESTFDDEAVGECIAAAIKRWTFPTPVGGGVVVVTMPFVLNPPSEG